MKNIRTFGAVEKRETGKFRARFTEGKSKISLGQFDTKEEAERALQEYMKKNNIECKSFYNNLISSNKILEPIIKSDLRNAKKCSKSLVCIPSNDRISIQAFNKILKKMLQFNIKQ